jgi:hypothetical protein
MPTVIRSCDKRLLIGREVAVFMSYVPLPIKGLDSSPVRAYAIEGMDGFS